jgi:hypothetical protein
MQPVSIHDKATLITARQALLFLRFPGTDARRFLFVTMQLPNVESLDNTARHCALTFGSFLLTDQLTI